MIKITMANSDVVTWGEEAYTDYKYDGKFFIIMQDEQWVGFYNLNHVISIVLINDSGKSEKNGSKPDESCVDSAITEEEIDGIFKELRRVRGAIHEQRHSG